MRVSELAAEAEQVAWELFLMESVPFEHIATKFERVAFAAGWKSALEMVLAMVEEKRANG